MLVPSHPPSGEAYQDGVSRVVAIHLESVHSIAKLLKPRRTGVVTLSLRARDSLWICKWPNPVIPEIERHARMKGKSLELRD